MGLVDSAKSLSIKGLRLFAAKKVGISATVAPKIKKPVQKDWLHENIHKRVRGMYEKGGPNEKALGR